MKRLLVTAALALSLTTAAHACDPSTWAATAMVYDKVCKKLPSEYLKAVVKAALPDQLREALTQELEEAKTESYCQTNTRTVEMSVAYFRKHPKERCL